MADSNETVKIETPMGRLINNSFNVKDVYTNAKGQDGVPSYKAEMVFDPDDLEEFEAAIVDVCVDEWGADAEDEYWDGDIRSPIREGNELADDREERGKSGDAYRDKLVIRAHSVFNKFGEDAPGGIYVCGPDAEELDDTERGKLVRNGCFGKMNVTLSPYKVDRQRGVTLYLNGFQYMEEGERLGGSDPSSLFKPAVSKGSSKGKGRRKRGS